jgi:hypothetical protein
MKCSMSYLSYKKNYDQWDLHSVGEGDSICKSMQLEYRPDIDYIGFPQIRKLRDIVV